MAPTHCVPKMFSVGPTSRLPWPSASKRQSRGQVPCQSPCYSAPAWAPRERRSSQAASTQCATEPWRIAGLRKGDSSQRERKGCTNPADLPEYLTGSGCQRERKGPSQPWKPQPARTQGLQATRGILPKEAAASANARAAGNQWESQSPAQGLPTTMGALGCTKPRRLERLLVERIASASLSWASRRPATWYTSKRSAPKSRCPS